MNKEEIFILFEDIKYLMKTCDFIKIEGNIAMGVESKYIFKEVNLRLTIPFTMYITKTSDIMNIYKLENIDNCTLENNILSFEFDEVLYNYNLSSICMEGFNLLNHQYNKIKQLSYNISYNYYELNKNEQFIQLMNLKTADGASLFKLDKYVFSIYKGLLPVNKNDTVNLNISDQFDYFICDFTVLKPKNKYVKILLAYLNLNRNWC